ncbi:unnamed protein product [Clonostachys rhizophaga]|uniref:Uncharacterized protein n=1 Tax=Clonostachys rhizophaga TaxID=160324 RepID=A0A9N9VZ30_9HYPO|nr:unnamed protein product [Clonostachys rhizophaga]
MTLPFYKYFDPVASQMPIISGFVDETLKRGSQLSPFDEDLIRLAHLTDSLNTEQKVKGLEIVCEAAPLQLRLLQRFLQVGKASQPNYQLLAPYSYWALISISQLLGHHSWKLL